jgi:hypothetical protein
MTSPMKSDRWLREVELGNCCLRDVTEKQDKICHFYFPPNYFSLFRQGKADLKCSENTPPGISSDMGRYRWNSSSRSRSSNDSSGATNHHTRCPYRSRLRHIISGSSSDIQQIYMGSRARSGRQTSSGSRTSSTRQSITQPVPSTTSNDIMPYQCRHIWDSSALARVPNNSSGSQSMIRTRQIRSQVLSRTTWETLYILVPSDSGSENTTG